MQSRTKQVVQRRGDRKLFVTLHVIPHVIVPIISLRHRFALFEYFMEDMPIHKEMQGVGSCQGQNCNANGGEEIADMETNKTTEGFLQMAKSPELFPH